ncbi:MAG: metalloregulator ArsR/SmtB family transcription factor [Anaerolineaceae bacterium]
MNIIVKRKMDLTSIDLQTQVFKTLTHPARVAILNILRDGEHCVCHMEAYLGFRQSYISQQLAVLREAGLIQDRRDGWNIYYRVVNPQIFAVLDAVQEFTGQKIYSSSAPLVACNCPHCASKSNSD